MKIKHILLMVIGVLLGICLALGVSYAFFRASVDQSGENLVTSGCFKVDIENEDVPINLKNAFPMTDSDALSLRPYSITIKNNCTIAASYNINLDILNTTSEDLLEYIKTGIDGNSSLLTSLPNGTSYYSGVSMSKRIGGGVLQSGDTKALQMRVWIKSDATNEQVANLVFAARVHVDTAIAAQNKITSGNYVLYDLNNDGKASLGEKVCIDTECFYVYSSNAGSLKLIAEYNLNVGNNPYGGTETGLQNRKAKGSISGENSYATVKVSDYDDYSAGDNISLSSDNIGVYLYGTDNNSGYRKVLQDKGLEQTATVALMTKTELETLSEEPLNTGLITSWASSWLYSTSYWIATSFNDSGSIWNVNSDGRLTYTSYDNDSDYGVRPVIHMSNPFA